MQAQAYNRGGLVPLSRRHVTAADVRKGRVTLADVAGNQILTSMSIMAVNNLKGFAHHKLFPRVPIKAPTGQYFVHSAADAMRDVSRAIAAGSSHPYATVGGGYTAFTAQEYGVATFIPRQVSQSENSKQQAEAAVKFLTNWLMIGEERRFASAALTTGVWGTDYVGGTDFDRFGTQASGALNASAVPMSAITRGIERVGERGPDANTLFISSVVWNIMARHPDVLATFQYVKGGLLTADDLQGYLRGFTGDPDFQVIIGKASYNSAAEGAAAVLGRIHSDYMWIGYVDRAPGDYSAGAGATLTWVDFDQEDFSEIPSIGVDSYYDEERRIDVYRGNLFRVYQVTNANAGVFYSDCLA